MWPNVTWLGEAGKVIKVVKLLVAHDRLQEMASGQAVSERNIKLILKRPYALICKQMKMVQETGRFG